MNLLPTDKIKRMFSEHHSHIQEKMHFAAHSHHPWPDVSKIAHVQYWMDSSRFIDDKWSHVFSEVIPKMQKKVAEILNIKDSNQIAIAPNTHELVTRLLSTFELGRPVKILTTRDEFHSFNRQTQRMEESGLVTMTRLDADELAVSRDGFLSNVKSELARGEYDLFFMSQVFFDSGIMVTCDELLDLVRAAPSSTVICIDGYHAFCAVPLDLSALEGRIFYLAGGYKYAQAGEGACFMVVPKGDWRPVNTGWMADIGHLAEGGKGLVSYAHDGSAFVGATQDASGFYRFNAVWDQYAREGIDVTAIHNHVVVLQDEFIARKGDTLFAHHELINAAQPRGHFLTFDMGSPDHCVKVHDLLREHGVLTDYRGQRLRIGFGLYQSLAQVTELVRICTALKGNSKTDVQSLVCVLKAHAAAIPSYLARAAETQQNPLKAAVFEFRPPALQIPLTQEVELEYFSLLKWLFHTWFCVESLVLNRKIDETALPSVLISEISSLARKLERHPVLTYEDYILLNTTDAHLQQQGTDSSNSVSDEKKESVFDFHCIASSNQSMDSHDTMSSSNSHSPISVEHSTALKFAHKVPLYTFTGLKDEVWFVQIHLYVEEHLERALLHMRALQNHSAGTPSLHEIHTTLQLLITLVTKAAKTIVRMIEHCEPDVFLHVIRQYFAKIPKRFYAPGVAGVYAGVSGAQASFEPLIDAFLSIQFETPDVFEFHSYMPPDDRKLMEHLRAIDVRKVIEMPFDAAVTGQHLSAPSLAAHSLLKGSLVKDSLCPTGERNGATRSVSNVSVSDSLAGFSHSTALTDYDSADERSSLTDVSRAEVQAAYDRAIDAVVEFREAHIAFISGYIPGQQGTGGSNGFKHLRDRIADTQNMKFSK